MLKSPGKLKAWKEAILKHHAVVINDDTWVGDTPTRDGYYGVFAITDFRMDETGSDHSFTITRWLDAPSPRQVDQLSCASARP